MLWLHKLLLKTRPYHLFMDWTKVVIVPGFSPLPLYTVGTFFFQEIAKDSLVNKASSLAYNFMLAIFPAIIFVFTLIPYFPEGFQDELMSLMMLVLPRETYVAVETTLIDIIKQQNGGLLSFGFVAALFFATNGIINLMSAFNKSSLIIETRGWLKQRIVAVNLTVLMFIALMLGIFVMTLGEYIVTLVKPGLRLHDSFWIFFKNLIKWIVLIGIYFVTISLLYRYGPAHTKKWKMFSPGSWLATILAVLTFWGFGYYINNFGNYNKLYGSIGTLIVIMIWLYLNSLIILLGFELNASIELSKRSIKIVKPKFNTFKDEPVQERLAK
jgi:membrane protein